MKYTYPVIFENDDGKIGVSVPDISGCFTFGETITEAIEMAEDAMSMMLAHYEDNNQEIPKPSDISKIKTRNGFVNYVIADTDKWRRQFSEKSVKKTVTIPAWLNYKAENANLNFSQELQNALKAKLQIAL
ncbi:MAG: type II toxin-antitoxin system HicB family antitoxin [Treponema sp.]